MLLCRSSPRTPHGYCCSLRLPCALLSCSPRRTCARWSAQDVEAAAQAVAISDDITSLLHTSQRNLFSSDHNVSTDTVAQGAVSHTSLSPVLRQPPASPTVPHDGRDASGKIPMTNSVIGSLHAGDSEHAVRTLQREIQTEMQRQVSHMVSNVGGIRGRTPSSPDGVTSPTGTTRSGGPADPLNSFTDRQGSVWRRSDKLLGKGSFGEVWLGMSEEGALVAMKMLRLHGAVALQANARTESKEVGPPSTAQNPAGLVPSPRVDGEKKEVDGLERVVSQELATPMPPPASGLNPKSSDDLTKDQQQWQDTAASFFTCSWTPEKDAVANQPTQAPSGPGGDAAAVLEMVEEVLKEVNLLSTLRHDNIVCYMSSAVVQGHVVICMEYVPGGSLQTVLGQFGILTHSSVLRYTKDILNGLAFLHSNGVIHRDFKPGNVLLQVDGLCKLADFGASSALGDATGRKVVGTLLYMSPEACRGEACAASDCWAVGIAVIQMVTGRVPYNTKGLDPSSFLYKLARGQGLPEVPDELSEGARAFVAGCLSIDHLKRPTAEELLLHAFLNA